MPAPTPQELLTAIAADALSANITAPMPVAPPGSPANAASVQDGFPPVTMQSELSGGLPPLGQDMNGLLFLISSHTLWVESGQLYLFNSDVAAAIGGYAIGSILGMDDGSGIWFCTLANNTNDPDTGGAGWVPLYSYGHSSMSVAPGGVFTPTTAELEKEVLVFTGALTSNSTVILPQSERQYLLVNATTGAFSLTAITSAVGSVGTPIPQGGFSAPVGVYSVGDGNIYPTVAPLTVPSAVAPTPNTLALRDNLGRIFATYFNQNSSSTENPTIGAVFVESAAADGYLRKCSLANFAQQLLGSNVIQFRTGTYNITGNVAPGTVNFSTPFPNACLGVVTSVPSGGFQPGSSGYTPTRFVPNGNACGTQLATYLAFGF